jgi:hypothetical protein
VRGTTRIAVVALAAATAGSAPSATERAGPFVHDGPKLTAGTKAQFGASVALSDDGSTAIVGGSKRWSDGAAWILARDGSGRLRVVTALRPSEGSGFVFGAAVALSADGNTALIGIDEAAAWVFARTAGSWVEQGRLTPGSPASRDRVSNALALSADGSTALVGAHWDGRSRGAGWVFRRCDGIWRQDGRLTVTGAGNGPRFGRNAALTADGTAAVIGGVGEVLVFVRTAAG